MLTKLTEGVWLSEGKVRAKRARIVSRQGQATMLELVLAEGKKREIRRMLSKLGHKVMSLNRIAVGPIGLKGLSVGECRPLSRHEVELLRKVASGDSVAPPRFFDGDSSSRPRRESTRPRGLEKPRPGRHTNHSSPASAQHDGDSPPQKNARHPQSEPGPHTRSRRPPQSRPGNPASSASSNRPSTAPKNDRTGPAKLPVPPRSKNKPPDAPRRPRPSNALPPEPLKPRRRIIGMEPEPTVARNRPPTAEGGGRKRPTVRKRRPPGPILGKKRKPPFKAADGDNEND
jgi:23S rRNA pseudouridine2605 synthase